MESTNLRKSRLNNWVSLSFKVGVAVSLTLIVIGLVLIGIAGAKVVEPTVPLTQLPQEILKLNATAIITLGILTLLLTPILQIVAAMATFSIHRNKLYLGISITLLSILAFSLMLALM
jgi:uncharacterized membrane protein